MKIVCFGEIMMRLNPEGYQRFVQAERYEASYAGGEANVAVSLANYGLEASFVTKLPANPIGESARNAVRHYGVDTKDIVWGGPRLGIYFVEKGASQRASKVVYDRAESRNACRRKRYRPRPERAPSPESKPLTIDKGRLLSSCSVFFKRAVDIVL